MTRNDGKPIYELWGQRLKDARLRLQFARNYVAEVRRDFAPDIPESDHQFAVQEALRAETLALSEYRHILRIYTNLGVRGAQNQLDAVLKMAAGDTGTDLGNIQVFDRQKKSLRIKAQIGFKSPFLDFFASVHDARGASCGAALKTAERIIVEDVRQSEIFAGTTALQVLLDAGVQSCQSTPLIGPAGELVGMLNTHYREPWRPSNRDLRAIDELAAPAAFILSERLTADGIGFPRD